MQLLFFMPESEKQVRTRAVLVPAPLHRPLFVPLVPLLMAKNDPEYLPAHHPDSVAWMIEQQDRAPPAPGRLPAYVLRHSSENVGAM
ncbi:MAG: hypothetical protein COW18_04850 [Zetaproteobacteria bacterium CG12_big_fil_rev_8_21_14_0_65_54_13]|nr:MAG: hypothetical protein COW18_04850 [Zetaproteobacteria bacterium CG12_big_fil_rev_8_21_14_0_65_54_13]PIX53972.1 MAG: hypothetical protein COZ50_10405 [Zetaproteobacteria bacterium CG_4_10_14_3_um_filter_54_28]PJA28156.1 MAG: hypothetical protein CO188_10390 [Zetaproteobacteria bacterium CG_4_9_14_3_um_filter_54_145]